jgi:VWFA-related protein
VLDKKGRFIGGLKQENFRIFEDGSEQEIAYFSTEHEPFTVALVLDMSYSTKFKIAEIQSAAIEFINLLGPRDRIMVVSFDQDVHMLCEPTSDRNAIYRAIRSTRISTGTSLYEAVDLVVNDRLRRIRGRKAMILFTDGVDTTSMRVGDAQNLADVLELDALVYPIRYDTFADVQAMKDRPIVDPAVIKSPIPSKDPGNSLPFPIKVIGTPGGRGTSAEEYRRAQEYLDQLAVRTAGRLYEANTMVNLASAFSRIASELREFYSLGFYPKDVQSGRLRRLKVKLDQPGLSVKARESYVAGKRSKGGK